ncbi:MAG: peptidoglycan-binding protein [Anaerolineae bacterium]|nr:peptidoglycan-binding protein [Anaerolineae bacterium]
MEKAKLKWQCLIPPVSGEIECQFNPAELTISKEAAWEGEKSPSFTSPWLQFAGGEAATYSLSLFFDSYSYESAPNVPDPKDVRELTNQLLQLTLRGAGRSMFVVPFSNPPMVTFIWGKITLFMAVVEKVEITYTMFSPDGLPIRAKADVSFKQQDFWDDIIPAQNPTSRTDSRKTRRVHAGQRLDQIAFEEYGDARYWRLLAESNGMDDPFELVDGQLLVIPQDK